MLGTAAVMTVLQISGYALMAVGIGTVVWLVLSFLKPQARRRALVGMGCTLALAVGTVKLFWGRGPENASAAPASAPQSPLTSETPIPATLPAVATVAVRHPERSTPAAPKPNHPAATPTPAAAQPAADPDLADAYVDHANGYSIRFPAGWSNTEYTGGDPWFIEVSDGKSGLISIGFSRFPASAGIDQLNASQMSARLNSQRHTAVEGHGQTTLAGQTCLWLKYTGPIKSSAGDQLMTVIHYYLPLHDGRMLELRVAASPHAFAKQARILRKSAASVKLLPL